MEMKITFGAGKRVNAQVNGFEIKTDQPPTGGGDGSAPEPFTLFLASLGTCAGIYVLGFCQARGIPTDGISLTERVEFDREKHRLARVGVEIHLPPSFPEKYRDAVRRAAETCAVKKALFDPPELTVTTTTVG